VFPEMTATKEPLIRAMEKAVELGVFPKYGDENSYLKAWSDMRQILEAALAEPLGHWTDDELKDMLGDNNE